MVDPVNRQDEPNAAYLLATTLVCPDNLNRESKGNTLFPQINFLELIDLCKRLWIGLP